MIPDFARPVLSLLVPSRRFHGLRTRFQRVLHNAARRLPAALRARLGAAGLAALFAALLWGAFCAFFDPSILDPRNIGWIAEGDLRQHYLGWVALRQAETLGWPVGTSPLLAHPFGAPISSTDSNPLISLMLWPLSDWLPADFQFIGPWYLMSLGLSLFFATVVLAGAGFDRVTAMLLGAALAFQPVLFWRYGHDTLTAHWLILAVFHVVLCVRRFRAALAFHAALLALAIAIHPYLFVMLALISLADLFWRILRYQGPGFGLIERTALAGAAALAGALGVGHALGVFALEQTYPSAIGVHSTDPIGFFNSFGASRLVPELPSGAGQYEGFAYVGLGGLVLGLAALGLVLRRAGARVDWWRLTPVLAAGGLGYLFALSPVVTLLGAEVFALDLSDDSPLRGLFAKLRSSGRFVWLAVYAGALLAILCLPRARRGPVRALAVGVLALQLWDLGPLRERSRADTAWRAPAAHQLATGDWQERIGRADYVYLSRSLGLDFSLEVGAVAFPLGTPLTWFYTAQGLGYPRQIAAEEQLRRQVLGGQHVAGALYLLGPSDELALVHRNGQGPVITHDFGDFHALQTAAFAPDVATPGPGASLADILQSCLSDCTAAVVGAGDVTGFLSRADRVWLGGQGSRLGALAAGEGVALLMRNGATLDEARVPGADAVIDAMVGGRAFSLRGSAVETGAGGTLQLDGQDFARLGQGFRVMLVHDDGRLLSALIDTPVAEPADSAPVTLAAARPEAQAPLAPREEALEQADLFVAYPRALGPVSAEPFVALGRVLTRESSLLDVMTRCRQDCAMAISVKDEGSTSMPLAVRTLARQMGLTLADLSFRDGYAAIVEDGIVLVQGLSQDELVDVAEVVDGHQLRVRSAGYVAGNLASVMVDGTELSLNQRGINIIVLLPGGDTISYHFDTHGGL